MENISDNITYNEAIKSITAIRFNINNTPGKKELVNMKRLAVNVFEPLRKELGNFPIHLNSFYRCPKLNKMEGGVKNSHHLALNNMAAIDIDNDGFYPTNEEIFYYIKNNLMFDQLIWERGDDNNPAWVHVSFGLTNRKQVLRKRIGAKRYEVF